MKGTIIAGPMLNHGLKRLGKDSNGVYATNGQKKVYLTTDNIKSVEIQRQGKKKLSLGKALLFNARYTVALPVSLPRVFGSTVADAKYTPASGIVTSQSVVTVCVTSITDEPTLDT